MKSSEPRQIRATRQKIVLLLGLFIVFLGVPLFQYTTQIHRAELPRSSVQDRIAAFQQSVRFNIPVHVHGGSADFLKSTQREIDLSLQKAGLAQTWSLELKSVDEPLSSTDVDSVTLIHSSQRDTLRHEFSASTRAVFVYSSDSFSPGAGADTYTANVLLNDVYGQELAAFSALAQGKTADAVFPFASKYNVILNFLVADGKTVDWGFEHASELSSLVTLPLSSYSSLHHSTQTHYYSKLSNQPVYDEDRKAYIISRQDLSTFVNYGEWNLDSHDIYPTINFILYYPGSSFKNVPLLIENSTSNSFLIPQWGGVYVYNPKMPPVKGSSIKISDSELHHVFDIFASQMFELLGVPKSPASPWARIASFHRISSMKNLKRSLDNLAALHKLSESLNGISIPEATRTNVLDAIAYYDEALDHLKNCSFEEAIRASVLSVEKSDKAFFEKEMVQQAYFPSEHKLAVFSPLLGPLCSIVLFGVIKTVKNWKKEEIDETDESAESKKEM